MYMFLVLDLMSHFKYVDKPEYISQIEKTFFHIGLSHVPSKQRQQKAINK